MEKFKDIFQFAPKSKIKAGEGLDKGRFPFYTSSAIQNKWIDTEQHFDEALIFGTGGSASIHYESQPFSTSTDCFVTITTRRDVNTKYVYYFLASNIHLLERGFKGAGLKHLSKAFLEEIEFPLPDLETQNKIVAILDKAKAILDKREETIRKYDELLRATFLEMFGDPVKNEKKFETSSLSKFGTLKNGLNYSGDESGYELSCLGVGDFKSHWNIYDINNLSKINVSNLPSDDYFLKDGDLVFVRSNGNKELVVIRPLKYPDTIAE